IRDRTVTGVQTCALPILFFRRHGMDESLTDKLLGSGQDYLKRVSILPPSYRRISHGDEITIGTRRFKVITGGGHALDQVMLYCEIGRASCRERVESGVGA